MLVLYTQKKEKSSKIRIILILKIKFHNLAVAELESGVGFVRDVEEVCTDHAANRGKSMP